MHALQGLIAGAVAAQRAAPRAIIGELMALDFDGLKLTDEGLRLIVTNLLNGGLGTTPVFGGSVTVFLAAEYGPGRLDQRGQSRLNLKNSRLPRSRIQTTLTPLIPLILQLDA